MPVAVQAVPFLVALGVAGLLLGFAAGPWGVALPALLALAVLAFFRDPHRESPDGDGIVVSPADGRVTAVESTPAGGRVSIFLSVADCHINRSPVDGVVRDRRYTAGRFRPAWDARAASENERNDLTIDAPEGAFGVTQIAGILARRIVCTANPGDNVERGGRIGLIRFGSRTDVHLPAGVRPVVTKGDRVRGGVTIVARAGGAPEGGR